ncbi:MAG: hypothetical protein ABID38_07020 [Candidatus Diapherotrites archaeon]
MVRKDISALSDVEQAFFREILHGFTSKRQIPELSQRLWELAGRFAEEKSMDRNLLAVSAVVKNKMSISPHVSFLFELEKIIKRDTGQSKKITREETLKYIDGLGRTTLAKFIRRPKIKSGFKSPGVIDDRIRATMGRVSRKKRKGRKGANEIKRTRKFR